MRCCVLVVGVLLVAQSRALCIGDNCSSDASRTFEFALGRTVTSLLHSINGVPSLSRPWNDATTVSVLLAAFEVTALLLLIWTCVPCLLFTVPRKPTAAKGVYSVFVRGLNGRSLCFAVTAETTVQELRTILKGRIGCAVDHVRLWHANKRLDETVASASLASLGIGRDTTLEVQGLLAGGIKRKQADLGEQSAQQPRLATPVLNSRVSDTTRDLHWPFTINPAEQRTYLRRRLDELVEAKDLCDLHTHLLGMGDADFWIDEIWKLKDVDSTEIYVSAVEFSRKGDFGARSDARVRFFKQILNRRPNTRLEETSYAPVTHRCEGYKLSSDQVSLVFGDLKDALDGIESDAQKRWCSEASPVDNGLRVAISRCKRLAVTKRAVFSTKQVEHNRITFKGPPRQFAHFNARTQMFELVEGWSIDQLRPRGRRALYGDSALRGAFTIQTEDHITFTPHFDPKCFAIKDALYQHDLTVLDSLLNKVLVDYYDSGVGYVEFSMGYKDLMLRPWVFHHLISPTTIKVPGGDSQLQVEEGGGENRIWFNYLAALPRHIVQLPGEAVPFLADRGSQAANLAFDARGPRYYPYQKFVDAADDMECAYNALPGNDPKGPKDLLARVVALDLVGNEYGYPYCPFWLEPLVDFAHRRMYDNNQDFKNWRVFGFRPHLGEVTEDGYKELLGGCRHRARAAYNAHMSILKRTIELMFVEVDRSGPRPSFRFGHGVAIAVPSVLDYLYDIGIEPRFSLSIELCWTSNCVLLKGFEDHPVTREPLPWTVCTDDDGIIQTKCRTCHGRHRLVAGQICELIEKGVFSLLSPFDTSRLDRMAKPIGFRRRFVEIAKGWPRGSRPLQTAVLARRRNEPNRPNQAGSFRDIRPFEWVRQRIGSLFRAVFGGQ